LNKKEREKQIVESALKVFNQNGYTKATTSSIAKEAGISEVTLFRYFNSKEEVFVKSIKLIFDTLLKNNEQIDQNLSKEEKFKTLLLNKIDLISKNKESVLLLLNESDLISKFQDTSFLEIIEENFKSLFNMFNFEKEKQEIAIRLIMGSILSFIYLPNSKHIKREDFINEISYMIFNTLQQGEI